MKELFMVNISFILLMILFKITTAPLFIIIALIVILVLLIINEHADELIDKLDEVFGEETKLTNKEKENK